MKDSRVSLLPVVCGATFWLVLLAPLPAAEPAVTGELRVQPQALTLVHPRQPHSILVRGTTADGLVLDLTGSATFASADETIAVVDSFGWVRPIASGKTAITVRAAGRTATLPVTVELKPGTPPTSFRHEVMPVFSKAGCNSGACHGYSLGKNGFKLSLRGGDEKADYESLTQEFLGRRINRHRPEASLILKKPLGEVAHRGGVLMEAGDLLHETLLRWVREGAPSDLADPLRL
ncbi:MAG: Ig-like domain-containing protein, partial [Planctomycetes bacterium]|nr:Ig-like domain-containing protein [Planctomycetota bacterium]